MYLKLGGRCPNCDCSFGANAVQFALDGGGKYLYPGDVLVCVGCGLGLLLEVDSQDENLLVVREISTEELRKATKALEFIRT